MRGGVSDSRMTTICRGGLLFITELEVSTKMFGNLADPNGANNALSQVLYGLALRYDNYPSTCTAYF